MSEQTHRDAAIEAEKEACRYCAEGFKRIPSAVSAAFVHPDTQTGRQVCERPARSAEDVLRALASFVGNGGYNSPFVNPEEFDAKIRDGINTLTRVENKRGYDAGYLAAKQEPCQNCGHSTDPLWAEKAEHCFKCNRHQSKCICESDRPDARQAECEEKQ
jgi:hypothetical protein